MNNEVDPYIRLAKHLVLTVPAAQLKPGLVDSQVILKLLQDEFRDIDYSGPILDTIISDHHTLRGSIWVHQAMDKAAIPFFEGLDLPRLRRYIASMYLNM